MTKIANKQISTADAERASQIGAELVTLLDRLAESERLSPDIQHALADAAFELDKADLTNVISQALEELNPTPETPDQVGIDHVEVSHGAITCFDIWASNKADGGAPDKEGRESTDSYRLIERFMQDHPAIEVSTRRTPFGSGKEKFDIEGTRTDRDTFQSDDRFARLVEALEDIYWTDYSGGYADKIKEYRRTYADPDQHVFGS